MGTPGEKGVGTGKGGEGTPARDRMDGNKGKREGTKGW